MSPGKIIDTGFAVLETAWAVVVTVTVFVYWLLWCSWREVPEDGDQ